jgi:hypothetical protein
VAFGEEVILDELEVALGVMIVVLVVFLYGFPTVLLKSGI